MVLDDPGHVGNRDRRNDHFAARRQSQRVEQQIQTRSHRECRRIASSGGIQSLPTIDCVEGRPRETRRLATGQTPDRSNRCPTVCEATWSESFRRFCGERSYGKRGNSELPVHRACRVYAATLNEPSQVVILSISQKLFCRILRRGAQRSDDLTENSLLILFYSGFCIFTPSSSASAA